MTIIASDNFTNTNGTDIEAHDSNWSYVDGGQTDDIQIEGNVARAEWDSASGYGASWDAVFANDQYSQAKVTAVVADRYVGVCLRLTHYYDDYYFWNVSTQDGSGSIEKYVGGTWSGLIGSGDGVSVNDIIRLEVIGDQLEALVDDSQNLTIGDSSHTAGDAGIYFFNGGELASLDDWEGGNIEGITNIERSQPRGVIRGVSRGSI